jgi:Uma2 family endonuclease
MNAITDSGVMKHRLTVDEYYGMAELGLLAPDARMELIDGEIVDMPPMGSRHGGTGMLLNQRFMKAVADAAVVTVGSALILGNYSAPQPDLMLLRPRSDFYRRSNPRSEDVFLVVEISDSTWRYDREIKAPLYARHDVSDFWIVNLREAELHCFRGPRRGEFTEAVTIKNPGLVPVQSLGNVQVDLTGLFD